MALVYKLTSPSGKLYIGMTTLTVERRWASHKDKARRGTPWALHEAIRKYGADSFTVEVVQDGLTDQEAFALEIATIDALGSMAPGGYNLTSGGEGVVATQEINDRRGEKLRVLYSDPDTKAKMSEAAKLRAQNPETKAKQVEGARRRFSDPEERARLSAARMGHKTSDDHRAKMRAGWAARKARKAAESAAK